LELVERQGQGKGTHYKVPVKPAPPVATANVPVGKLAQLIAEDGFVTNASYRKAFNVEREEAKTALAQLVERGVLVRVGERKGARYERGPNWKGPS
jgi:predicted HTH transcriptional regulator